MALSKSVEESLKEAEQNLRNAWHLLLVKRNHLLRNILLI
jgi:hypothetical protein